MLAHPAKARAHGPGFVHHWLNINAYLTFGFRPFLFDPIEQRAQFVAQHFVIIVAPGVARDFAG